MATILCIRLIDADLNHLLCRSGIKSILRFGNMAAENGFGGKITADEATTSESYPEAEKIPSTNGDQEDSKKSKVDEKTNVIPFRKLFSFADSTDILMMYLGTIGAIGNGICMPLMTILFGELTDSFGDNQNNHEVVEVVSKVKIFCKVLLIWLHCYFFLCY